MALNDIIVAKEGSGGVLAEIALAPADIGAVASNDARLTDARTPTAHASTHHTGGSDAIAPNNIGAAWALVLSNQTITGNTLLAAGRNRRISIGSTSAVTANVDLPHENNQAGDIVTLVGVIIGPPVIGTYTIRAAAQMAGSPSAPIAYSTLATLNASGQSFTFISDGTATGWSLLPVNAHTHAATDITSGVLDFDRIQQVLTAQTGSDDIDGPDIYDAAPYLVGGNLHALILASTGVEEGYLRIRLPDLATNAVGQVTVRAVDFLQDPSTLRVQITDEGNSPIFPATGAYEMDIGEEFTFRWNEGRWVMDLRPNPLATAVSHQIFKPNASGTLVISSTTGIAGADAVTNIVSLTQAEYNAIGSPDAATLFLITDP